MQKYLRKNIKPLKRITNCYIGLFCANCFLWFSSVLNEQNLHFWNPALFNILKQACWKMIRIVCELSDLNFIQWVDHKKQATKYMYVLSFTWLVCFAVLCFAGLVCFALLCFAWPKFPLSCNASLCSCSFVFAFSIRFNFSPYSSKERCALY